MRTLLKFLVLLLAAIPLASQTPSELHARYGDPNEERFTVRPGISVSVEYGSDHAVCRFVIDPVPVTESRKHIVAQAAHSGSQSSSGETLQQYGGLNNPPPLAYIPIESSEEVLEELVPVSNRGEEVSHVIWESGRTQIMNIEYSNVSISRSIDDPGQNKPGLLRRITATLKRDGCHN
jgi:hypothetical protein